MRWRLGPGRDAAHLRQLIEENPEAAEFIEPERITPPDDAEVREEFALLWAAFWDLGADRPMVPTPIALPTGGLSFLPKPGAIPFTAIDAYARRMGWDGDAFAILHRVMQRLDQVWLALQAERDGDADG